jgi:hypothetical protein
VVAAAVNTNRVIGEEEADAIEINKDITMGKGSMWRTRNSGQKEKEGKSIVI